jgi:hypothetical protein
LLWSSYFGGTGTDTGTGIALDTGAANVYITGSTSSGDITLLVTFAAFQTCLDQYPNPPSGTACTNTSTTTTYPSDAYVARFTNPTSTTVGTTNLSLNYFSYLGGSGNDAGLALTVDAAAGALMTGWTKSADFPVLPANSAIQGHLLGVQNAFMARINTVAQQGQTTGASWSNYYGGSGTDEGTSVALDVNQNSYFAGDTNSPNLRLNGPLPPAEGGTYIAGYDAFVAQVGSSCNIGITGIPQLGTNQQYFSAGTQATFVYTITNGGPDLCTGLVVQDNISQSITNVALTFVSASTTSGGTCSGAISSANSVACTIPSLQSGQTATVQFVLTPTANSSGLPQAFNGGSVQVLGVNNIVLAHTTVSANMSDFSIAVNPSSFSVLAAGDTASYTVLLSPHPIYGNIALSCSQLPAGTACNFTTTPVTLQSQSPVSPTLNITTTARPIVTPASLMLLPRFLAVTLCVPGLAIFGVGLADRRRRRIVGIFMLCALFGMLLLQPACTHGTTPIPTSGTQAGQYTIIITATGGTNDTKSSSVVLNVP